MCEQHIKTLNSCFQLISMYACIPTAYVQTFSYTYNYREIPSAVIYTWILQKEHMLS